jgi:hypothetical protein
MTRYTAPSKTEFLHWLKNQDITVPARTEGRTTKHCERRAMFRLLATWAKCDRLCYPLMLTHRDRPDFLLCYDGQNVGIEFTEAVSEEWAETDALMEHEGKNVVMFLDNFKRGTPRRTASERRTIIQKRPYGPGWGDDGMEHEWALSINDFVIKKTKTFNKQGFQKYNENWLLIWDDLPIMIRNIETAMKYLMPELENYWLKKNRYDSLLVDSGNQLIQMCSSGWHQQPILNLWT